MYFPFHCDQLLLMSHIYLSSFVKRVPAVSFKPATPAHTDHGRVIKSFWLQMPEFVLWIAASQTILGVALDCNFYLGVLRAAQCAARCCQFLGEFPRVLQG